MPFALGYPVSKSRPKEGPMQKFNQLIILGLILVGGAQAQSKGVSLKKVRTIFSKADANQDGLLNRAEATAVGIPQRDMVRVDADKSGDLSGEEFVFYYSQLLTRAGRAPAKDLEVEAKRITDARRAAKKKAQERVDQARADKKAKDQGRADEARTDSKAKDQERIDQARADKKAKDQGRADEARTDSKAKDQARIDQARADKKAKDQGRKDAQKPTPSPETEIQGAIKSLRAAIQVGRVSADGAKNVLALLTNKGVPTNVEDLRLLHQSATTRVTALAKAGKLTPGEARELHKALTRRMQQAAAKHAPAGQNPAAKPPARRKAGGDSPARKAKPADGKKAEGRVKDAPRPEPVVKPADGNTRRKARAKKPASRPSDKGGRDGSRS